MLSRDGKAVHVTVSQRTPLRIYLIRHGETVWSLSGQFTGHRDISLPSHGEYEARELGLRIQCILLTHVFALGRSRIPLLVTLVMGGLPSKGDA